MAERVLFDIAGEIIQKLGSRALQEIGVWWGVKDELQKLKGTVSSIQAVLVDAEKRQALDEQVKGWLVKLQEVVYDADDLLDDFATEALRGQLMTGNRMTKEVSLFFSSSNRLVYGFKMGHKIKAIRERLDAIDEDRKKYGLHHVERPEASFYSRGRDQTISYVDEKQVIGRENDRKAIIDLLLDSNIADNVSVIPIVGMGGLGKTTLAQYVFGDENVKTHFELKLWVCVSEVFDLKVVVEKTLKSIGREPGNFELDQLQTNLREEIRGKKYLLVLDDVWNEDLQKWTDLKALLTCGARGSRILVTTRSDKVAGITSGKKPHYSLKGLALDKSWSLFEKIVFEGKEPGSPKVKEIGEQIIEKCVGVPLAIKTIASLLYFKDPEREWLPFLENDLSKIPQNENHILLTLQLSYDHLPSHLKHCFAYCALFPKDYVIDVKKLIHLWAAQGFIESSSSSLCDEDIGLQYFTELWWRSFFQEVERDEFGNIKSCKMHDFMHDLATSVAGEGICIINSEEKSVDKSVRHVSFDFYLNSSQQIPAGLSNALKLRTFLLPRQDFSTSDDVSKLPISKVIVPNFRELRVCDMHRAKIEKLFNSINKLKHLRYLDVSYNVKIVALPNSITNLQNLQVLNVSDCDRLKELPKDIKKLINLRHLYCDDCWSLTHMPRGLGQLTSLRTLTWFVVAKDNSVAKNVGGLNELNSLNNLRGSLEIRNFGYVKNGIINPILKDMSLLQSLSLFSDRDDDANVQSEEMAFQNLQPHPNLKELKVYEYRGTRFPSWVSSLTNLVNIQLWNCRCQHLPPLDQFPSLQMLEIWGLYDLEYIEIEGQAASFFPSLKVLKLCDCRKLIGCRMKRYEDDSDDSTTISSPDLLQFPCLSRFFCDGCPNLSLIPQFPSLDERLVLGKVSVQLVQQIFTTSISSSSSSSSISPPLSKLKKLIIWYIEDLEFLPPDGLHNLTSLQQLEIKECPRLTSLPQEMRSLTSLRELTISGCPLLSKRCVDKKGEDWPFISHIPNIEVDFKRIQWEGHYLLEDEEKISTASEME